MNITLIAIAQQSEHGKATEKAEMVLGGVREAGQKLKCLGNADMRSVLFIGFRDRENWAKPAMGRL